MIRGVGGPAPVVGGGRAARGGGGAFRVPDRAQGAEASAVAPAMAVGLSAMLALQEMPDPTVGDREARRHGQALLDELSALQRSMLAGGAPDPGRLARLAAAVPSATDPRLRETVAAIALRARIELARAEMSRAAAG